MSFTTGTDDRDSQTISRSTNQITEQGTDRGANGKRWFVTGASRGLGRAFIEAALSRGDQVAATARDVGSLDDLGPDAGRLLVLPLDVTDVAAVQEAVSQAVDHFGGLDVVVNNAGHGAVGAVEEVPDETFRAVMDVNFFGAVAVARACLPVLRAQGHGHLINITSMGGLIALPLAGAYIASKWALEGLSEALAAEVADFGVHVTIIEPGSFNTSQGAGSMGQTDTLTVYDPIRQAQQSRHLGPPPEDPAVAAQALLRVVDAPRPPLRVIFAAGGVEFVDHVYGERLSGWNAARSLFETDPQPVEEIPAPPSGRGGLKTDLSDRGALL